VTDLQDAVNELTQPIIEHMAQIGDDGKWIRTHTVEHPPLLHQLENAVNPSKNGGPGTPATPATRSILNFEALFLFAKISSEIKSWCLRRKLTGRLADRVEDLQAWADNVSADAEFDGSWYTRELHRWAALIRDTLNPGESFEAKIKCPICGATSWGDAINGGGSWSVAVSYRLDDRERMTDERAMCRACSTVWTGHEAVMELAEEAYESLKNA
jgi:hypothetical protein